MTVRRRLAVILLLGVVTLGGGAGWLLLGSLPQTRGSVEVPGLGRPVDVVRDEWAVPHIRAASELDLYRAVGFVHAQDRLWQMAMLRRLGEGRLAEILGASALPLDRFFRTLGLVGAAEASLSGLGPRTRALLDAYAGGVNAFLERRRGPLPPEFQVLWTSMRPWRAADTALVLKLMSLDLAANWRDELARARLAPSLTPDQLADLWPGSAPSDPVTYGRLASGAAAPWSQASLPAPAAPSGSNVWVVGPGRGEDGGALLANDPHLALTLPNSWYLVRLECPELGVAGATVPGIPFVVSGQGRAVSWGITNPGFDLQDVFIETVDPADPARYLAPGGARPFAVREETIGVRGGADERLIVRETRHGPVISDVIGGSGGGAVLSLAWTGLAADDASLEAGFEAARAEDADGFVEAFERFANPPLNIAWATAAGEIGMMSVGAVPLRRSGNGAMPVNGKTAAFDWVGLLPPAALPDARNPPRGWLANANNRLVDPDYPWFLTGYWEPAWRMRRIEEVLDGSEKFTIDAMRRLQTDRQSVAWRDLGPWLLAADTGDGHARAWRRRMADWDGGTGPGRAEPLVFWAWLAALGDLVWKDELGEASAEVGWPRTNFLSEVWRERRGWCDDVRTPAPERCEALSARALEEALLGLEREFGRGGEICCWGERHEALLAHRPLEEIPILNMLASRRVPVGGDSSTVAVAHVDITSGPPFTVRHAASLRTLIDLAAPERSRVVIPGGQSGHPFSRHYADQIPLWREGRYLPLHRKPDSGGRFLHLIPIGRDERRS